MWVEPSSTVGRSFLIRKVTNLARATDSLAFEVSRVRSWTSHKNLNCLLDFWCSLFLAVIPCYCFSWYNEQHSVGTGEAEHYRQLPCHTYDIFTICTKHE
jgi:hypothetical protein